MYLPPAVAGLLENRPLIPESIGMSGAEVLFAGDMVLKIESDNRDSRNNLAMMRWLKGKLNVPEVLAEETQGNVRWLLMKRLTGQMACSPALLARPKKLVAELARALEAWWNVDPAGCPCEQTLARKLDAAAEQVELGLVDMDHVEPDTFGPGGFASPEALLRWLVENQPEERPVLSHGDFCLPNVFLTRNAAPGFLDLGRSGTADRWLDIAILWRSLRDNFNGTHGHFDPDFDPDWLFDALDLRPDREKMRYYLLLDELF
jgi:kanamycin kinase/aminoglycoside 3'-phosphotransferase-3